MKLLLFLFFTVPFFLEDNIQILIFFGISGIFLLVNTLVFNKEKELRINKSVITYVMCISIVVLIGFTSILLSHDTFIIKNIIRDIIYIYSGTIIFFTTSILLRRKNNLLLTDFLNILYIAIFFLTSFYLWEILRSLNFQYSSLFDFNNLFRARREAGEIPNLTSIGLGVLILIKHEKNLIKKAILLFSLIGCILFVSRTSILIIILAILVNLFYSQRRKKVLFVFIVAIVITIITLITQVSTNSNSINNDSVFINKIENSFSEVSFWNKEKFFNKEDIQNNWRSYESKSAIDNISEVSEYFFGKGLGSLFPLNLTITLDGNEFTEIPVIHNGLVYIVYKCGILGLLLYLFGFLKMFKFNNLNIVESKLFLFVCVTFLVNSITVTSLFNPSFSYSLWMILTILKVKENIISEDVG